jgi:hypothetical protein
MLHISNLIRTFIMLKDKRLSTSTGHNERSPRPLKDLKNLPRAGLENSQTRTGTHLKVKEKRGQSNTADRCETLISCLREVPVLKSVGKSHTWPVHHFVLVHTVAETVLKKIIQTSFYGFIKQGSFGRQTKGERHL